MSIELKPCPFCGSDSITNHDTLIGYSVGCDKCGAVAAHCATEAESISAWNTRTSIQQAESGPVGEPRARVELMKTGGNAGLSTRIIELDIATRERLRPGDLLYTHPAPGVPDDVARDAKRYRWLRDRDHWPAPFASSQDPEPVRGTDLDAAIDAAMIAAQAQKGQQ